MKKLFFIVFCAVVFLSYVPLFSHHEKIAFADQRSAISKATSTPVAPPGSYIQIIGGCTKLSGACVNARSNVGTTSTIVAKLRNGINLEIETLAYYDVHGKQWYKIKREKNLRYPEKIPLTMYVSTDYARRLEVMSVPPPRDKNKKVIVDISDQRLRAYEGSVLIFDFSVSTGRDDLGTPTPKGSFTVLKKEMSHTMQGPIPNVGITDSYNMIGVPFVVTFTPQGAAFHGAYWHDSFGKQHSHGCVNISVDESEKFYNWVPLGTKVIVQA